MISDHSETRDLGETNKEISVLKDEIKSKNLISEKLKKPKTKKISIEKSLKIFKNDINIKKPKYFGRTKSLFFIGETPIFILGESSKKIF